MRTRSGPKDSELISANLRPFRTNSGGEITQGRPTLG